jgi:Tfp pilus assembly protein PilV
VAWVSLLAGLLTAGVLGILLFNTALQRQATELTYRQQVANQLQVQTQQLAVTVHELSDPAVLALAARRLDMRPAQTVRWVSRHHHPSRRGHG